jgi:hypothetical protein
MRYRINWTESVGYYAYVEAASPEEALKIFHEDGPAGFSPPDSVPEPDGFCEMQDDAEATEDQDG